MDVDAIQPIPRRITVKVNFKSIAIALSFAITLAFGVLNATPAHANIADEIVCTPDNVQELQEVIEDEAQRHTGAIFNHDSWNNYFAANGYGRREALSLLACVRNTLAGIDGEIRAERDAEKQRELATLRNMMVVMYEAMGRAIAPNVRLPRTR